MRRFLLFLLALPVAATTPEELEFFESEIRPLLVEKCYSCHSAKAPTIYAGMRLDSREGLLKGGDSGAAIQPGDPAASRLMSLLNGKPLLMPPTGRLPEDRIAALSKWIEMGAPWPEETQTETDVSEAFDIEARKRAHWAWQPVKPVGVPAVRDEAWPSNDVDRFLLRKLEAKHLKPAKPAGRHALIRRLTFDLTGLPPTPAQIKSFIGDESPNAYVKLIRRLLESPHFGERWARHWMDLVRYTETHGSEGDPEIPDAWRYRDYLIRAFNADVGYDQLIREHLAGDLLDNPRIDEGLRLNESILGVAHLRMVEHSYQPIDPWEDRVKWTDNQVDVISKAFQGLTVSCARCHDHKFDAISQKDYYSLFGILYGARPTQRAIDAPDALNLHRDELADLKAEIRTALANQWLLAADKALANEDSWALTKALEEAACESDSPLNAWLELRDKSEAKFSAAWTELQSYWQAQIASREQFNDENFDATWEVPEDFSNWISHGVGTADAPSAPGEFAVLDSGDRALEGLHRAGVYSHLLSNKHGAVIQSPQFEIATDYISVKMLGGGFSNARLVVENYPVPRGGIYELLWSPRGDKMQWFSFKTDFWKGFKAYIEFSTRDDATNFGLDPIDRNKNPRPTRPKDGRSSIGAAAVAFHNNDDKPRETAPPILYLLDGAAPNGAKGLRQLISERLKEAIGAWRNGNVNELQIAFLDSFVRKDLLPRSLEQLPSVRPLIEKYRALEAEVPVARRAPGVVDDASPDHPLLLRGDPTKPGEPVARRFLTAMGGARYENPSTVRLALAKDVANPQNPLTARVMVNRIWGHLFDQGIVATPDNFGVLGERPSHPMLLDYLAKRFVDDGWSIKKMIELLVSTRAYQMSSVSSDNGGNSGDPTNELIGHMPVRRLSAEAIRDALLAVTGRLDRSVHGPPSRGESREDLRGFRELGDDRRSVYQPISRNVHNFFLESFDQPKPTATRGRRDVTNVPAQSLAMLNNELVIDLAREWGEHLAHGEALSIDSRINHMFLKALHRPATSVERDQAATYAAELAREHDIPETDILSSPEVWGGLAHALFNLKEFIYVG